MSFLTGAIFGFILCFLLFAWTADEIKIGNWRVK